jgi:hypothetical protein
MVVEVGHKRSGPETLADPLRACSLPRSRQKAHAKVSKRRLGQADPKAECLQWVESDVCFGWNTEISLVSLRAAQLLQFTDNCYQQFSDCVVCGNCC